MSSSQLVVAVFIFLSGLAYAWFVTDRWQTLILPHLVAKVIIGSLLAVIGQFAAVEATARSLNNCAVSVLTEMARHRVQFRATSDIHRLADEMAERLTAEAKKARRANRPG